MSDQHIEIDFKDLNGETALWAACQNNNADIVELLLHPRNVVVSETVVHKRVKSIPAPKFSMDEINLNKLNDYYPSDDEHDIDDDAPTANKPQNQNISEMSGSDDVEDSDISSDDNNNGSQSVIRNRNVIRRGANPNLANKHGCTPLWIASSRGNWESMKHLINYGAELNEADKSQVFSFCRLVLLYVSCH